MLLWDVRFVTDWTGRIAFFKEPILEPISFESKIFNIKKYVDSLRGTLRCFLINNILDN